MAIKREVRLRPIPDTFNGRKWTYKDQPIVRLGDIGNWTMVRRADFRNGMPFVISRKDWDKLPIAEDQP